MSDTSKKIFLALCIIVPFFIYCGYYYSAMIKNAPFRFSDLESIEITYGYPQEMLNSYNSKTQDYQYVTSDDKVVKEKLKLRDDDLSL